MYDTKYDEISKEVLINLVLGMGLLIRDLSPTQPWTKIYWTNEENETRPAYNQALEDAAAGRYFICQENSELYWTDDGYWHDGRRRGVRG